MLRIFPYMLIWMGSWLLYFPIAGTNPVAPTDKPGKVVSASISEFGSQMTLSFIANNWLSGWAGNHPIMGQGKWKSWFFGSGAAMLTLALLLLYQDKNSQKNQERFYLKKIRELEQTALRSQMNPHFIFNALNSIQSFIIEGDKKSSTIYLSKFSNLVRATLNQSTIRQISLAEELSMLNGYLELEQIRFNGAFDFEINVHPALDTFETCLPSMIVQPFIENAILHGLAPKEGKGTLLVEFQPHPSGLLVTVRDNGIGMEASKKRKQQRPENQSLGLKITANRLRLLSTQKGKNRVEIKALTDASGAVAGTEAKLLIGQV